MPNIELPKYKRKKKLFWVSTKDKDENWFIVASNSYSACKFHIDFEGYDDSSTKAKEICYVEKIYHKDSVYHAQIDMLEDLGFEILIAGMPRVVRKDGIIYKEGDVLNNVIMENSLNKEGLYIVHVVGSDMYKIGATRDFRSRLKNMQTGNPYVIEIFNFYHRSNYHELESLLHKKYKEKSIGGEWFRFNRIDLEEIDEYLRSSK